ncbi:hypothetical protein PENSPDRAFT_682439 [Peniophora sp. CONT]|nr:hypothetical protein PENSPDRAFT_682439 [Peniophora sp. CONT]
MSSRGPYRASEDQRTAVRDAIKKRLQEIPRESGQQTEQSVATAALTDSTENRLYALLIGVDHYAQQRGLTGAVKDASNIQTFLLAQHPPVRADRIMFLSNENATAVSIVRNIQALAHNDAIRPGDPILIYYAGHGATMPKPPGWPASTSHIQCLAPHDARVIGERVEGVVPDLTFGALLADLANSKGNKITVILDSCHSGSSTRKDSLSVARGIEFRSDDGTREYTISASYQNEIWGGAVERGLAKLDKFANGGLESHVVLAACGPDESAYEDFGTHEGRFTSAFLRVLKASGTDTMTYSELIRRLDNLPSQTPQCEGRDKDTRIIFDSGIAQRDRTCYTIERFIDGDRTSYIMQAGVINGINKGDTFAVYRDQHAFQTGKPSGGNLRVGAVQPITSTMSPVDDLHPDLNDWSSATAVLTRISPGSHNTFSIFIDQTKYPDLYAVVEALMEEALHSPEASDCSFILSNAATASISLYLLGSDELANAPPTVGAAGLPVTGKLIGFEILDESIRGLRLERLCGTVRLTEQHAILRSVLRSMAHFFYHLRSTPEKQGLSRVVSGNVRRIRREVDYDAIVPVPVYHPDGDPIDIKTQGGFYPHTARAGDHSDKRTVYGVDVVNTYKVGQGWDLFVWMFFFDCSTLEICKFYGAPKGNVQPPLRRGAAQPLPLNYGEAGLQPLTFELPVGQELDVGFLRIFVSTHNADLSRIAQRPVLGTRGVLSASKDWAMKPEIWDAITLAVVQKQ